MTPLALSGADGHVKSDLGAGGISSTSQISERARSITSISPSLMLDSIKQVSEHLQTNGAQILRGEIAASIGRESLNALYPSGLLRSPPAQLATLELVSENIRYETSGFARLFQTGQLSPSSAPLYRSRRIYIEKQSLHEQAAVLLPLPSPPPSQAGTFSLPVVPSSFLSPPPSATPSLSSLMSRSLSSADIGSGSGDALYPPGWYQPRAPPPPASETSSGSGIIDDMGSGSGSGPGYGSSGEVFEPPPMIPPPGGRVPQRSRLPPSMPPPSNPVAAPQGFKTSSSSGDTGVIIGVAVGSVVAAATCLILILLCRRRRRKRDIATLAV